MIWWNFYKTPTHDTNADDNDEEEEEKEDESTEDNEDKEFGNYKAMKNLLSDEFRLRHPKYVKRTVMHWHCFSTTALTFTRGGKFFLNHRHLFQFCFNVLSVKSIIFIFEQESIYTAVVWKVSW